MATHAEIRTAILDYFNSLLGRLVLQGPGGLFLKPVSLANKKYLKKERKRT
jgi:hypothetical protein